MHIIDRYAYTNRLRPVHPAYKTVLSCSILLLVLLLDAPSVSVVALCWTVALTVVAARIPAAAVARLLVAEGTFLALTVVGVVVSVGLREPGHSLPWAWQVGPLWLASSPAALRQGTALVLRALAGVSAMNFLALTTPLVDLIELLRRWRMPELLLDLMAVIYRFIFVLLETLTRIYTAQECRLGYRNRRTTLRSASLLGSQLLIDAFRRARRMQVALDSRGYDGALRVLPTAYATDARWPWLITGVALSLVGMWGLL